MCWQIMLQDKSTTTLQALLQQLVPVLWLDFYLRLNRDEQKGSATWESTLQAIGLNENRIFQLTFWSMVRQKWHHTDLEKIKFCHNFINRKFLFISFHNHLSSLHKNKCMWIWRLDSNLFTLTSDTRFR